MEVGILRNLRLTVLGAVCVWLAAGLACSTKEEPESRGAPADKPVPDQVISAFSITETSMGKKDWAMKAEKAYVYESRHVLEADRVEVTFYGERGEVKSVLSADYGKIDRNTNDMEAKGNVVVKGADGVVLETGSVMWQTKTRKIVSEDSVRVVRNTDVLTGWGFRGDSDLGSFEILKGMKATIRAR